MNIQLGSVDISSQLDHQEGAQTHNPSQGLGLPTLCSHVRDHFGLLYHDLLDCDLSLQTNSSRYLWQLA